MNINSRIFPINHWVVTLDAPRFSDVQQTSYRVVQYQEVFGRRQRANEQRDYLGSLLHLHIRPGRALSRQTGDSP